MEQKVSISELQKLEFKQAFQEFDKVANYNHASCNEYEDFNTN